MMDAGVVHDRFWSGIDTLNLEHISPRFVELHRGPSIPLVLDTRPLNYRNLVDRSKGISSRGSPSTTDERPPQYNDLFTESRSS